MFRPKPQLEESVFNKFVAKPDKVDYRARFIEKMEGLRNNPNVEFRYYENSPAYKRDKTPYTANYGVPEAVLRKIKKDYGREISEQMLAFYYQMNGCSMNWVYNNPDETDKTYIAGQMKLLELEEVMGGKWKESYLEWNSPDLFKDEGSVYYFNEEEAKENPEMAELMKHARIFDEQGEMQDFFVDFEEGKEEPTIYKIQRTNFYRLDIDFITFIEARIEFAGMRGWEYNYISGPYFSAGLKQRELTEFKENIVKVLPNVNFAKFGL